MPIFGVAQAGSNSTLGLNLTSLIPGEGMTLFDGTETPANDLKSVAFARGYSPSADDAGMSFQAWGMASDLTIDVESSNDDVHWTSDGTMNADTNGLSNFTDIGRSAFYRVRISAYTSGTMPTVTVQR